MCRAKLLIIFISLCFTQTFGDREIVRWIQSPRLTNWGSWGRKQFCPLNTYVSGLDLKIEPDLGRRGDDSALNGIKLHCSPIDGSAGVAITSDEGPWGFYRGMKYCQSGFATGFQLRSEPNLGSGDDAAAIDLKLKCLHDGGANSSYVVGGGVLTFGAWTEEQNCPTNTAICGISVQIEREQGAGDDSSLNNVDLACCRMEFDISTLYRVQSND